MKKFMHTMLTSNAPVFIILTMRQTAVDAYLDAGTGSIIVQALIGGLVGGLFALKIFWGRISTFFKNTISRERKRG